MNGQTDRKADSKINAIKKKVSAKIQDSKIWLVNCLNENVNKLSVAHKKISLVAFGLVLVAICASMIIRSVNDTGHSLSIEHITLPKDIYPNDEYRKGVKKILRIKTLLDSIRKSPGGLAVYDSLMNARPSLMDSFHSLIQSYQFDYQH